MEQLAMRIARVYRDVLLYPASYSLNTSKYTSDSASYN